MDGWIKLHRKFSDWEWFDNSEMVHLFIFLLLNANSENGNWRGITIKRGQILTGLHSLNERTGISIQTLRTCLTRLEKTGEINKQSNNQNSIITICNYESYQEKPQKSNKQPNKRPTSDQQATNNKQEEEEKKLVVVVVDNNIREWRENFEIYKNQVYTTLEQLTNDPDFISKQQKYYPSLDIITTLNKAVDIFWGTEAGWKHKKKSKAESIDWIATLTNAIGQPANKVFKQPLNNGSKPTNVYKHPAAQHQQTNNDYAANF